MEDKVADGVNDDENGCQEGKSETPTLEIEVAGSSCPNVENNEQRMNRWMNPTMIIMMPSPPAFPPLVSHSSTNAILLSLFLVG